MDALDCLKVLSVLTLVLFLKVHSTSFFQMRHRKLPPEDIARYARNDTKQGLKNQIKNNNESMDEHTKLLDSANNANNNPDNDNDKTEQNIKGAGFTDAERWQRIVLNDLENCILGLFGMWVAYLWYLKHKNKIKKNIVFYFSLLCPTFNLCSNATFFFMSLLFF